MSAIVTIDEFERVFEHGHHSEAEQIDFHDLHVGAVVFVPLHDNPVRHAGRFQRDDGIERPWQITMPPECWPRWRGKSCKPTTRPETSPLAIGQIETGFPELLFGCFGASVQPHIGTSFESLSSVTRSKPRTLPLRARRTVLGRR